MWPTGTSLSLARRIVISVALGLGLILLLFGVVALWTVQEITSAAYRERVVLAQIAARHTDDVFQYASEVLSREATAIGSTRDPALMDDVRAHLERLRAETGLFASLTVVDEHGTLIWRTTPPVSSPAPAEASSCQDTVHPLASQSATPVWTALAADRQTICLIAAIPGQTSLAGGMVIAELSPANIRPFLLAGSSDEGMVVQLVDETGQAIFAGRDSAAARQRTEHAELLAPFIKAGTAGYAVHESHPWDTEGSHLVAYAPLTLAPGWGIVVEQPKDLVVTMPRLIRWRLALFGLGALCVAVAMAWQDVRRVVRPLQHLTTAAERFAAGQLDQPIQSDRTDEIGILANAFETMRQRLRASLAEIAEWNRELERRVAARTAEVEAQHHELERLYEDLRARERERAELLQRVIAGQEEERRRLAQELHDDASQALASLQLGLERLAVGEEDPRVLRQLAGELQHIAAQTLTEIHRLAVELRPSVLDDVGLVAAIERYLREYTRRWNLVVDFAAADVDDFRLLPAAETAIYRIIQAALTNIAQHAQATHISVLLKRRDDSLVVVVEDDGIGFDLASIRAASIERRLGLAGMQERAALIGATLTIETAPGQGTTIFLEVPIRTNRREEDCDVEAPHCARG